MKKTFLVLSLCIAFGLGYTAANRRNARAADEFYRHAFDVKWADVTLSGEGSLLNLQTLDDKYFTVDPSHVHFRVDTKEHQPKIIPQSIIGDGKGKIEQLVLVMPNDQMATSWKDALQDGIEGPLFYSLGR